MISAERIDRARGARATYLRLRNRRICDLFARWESELEPLIFERVDVSPHVLAELGVGAVGHAAPQFVVRLTVEDMLAEPSFYPDAHPPAGSGSRPESTPVPITSTPTEATAGAHSRKPETDRA